MDPIIRKKGSPRCIGYAPGHALWTEAELKTPIPGEDRTFGGNLLWYEPFGPTMPSLHEIFSFYIFLDLRRFVVRRAGHVCEVCGKIAFPRQFERWEYDEKTKIRTLRRLICLCKQCQISSQRDLEGAPFNNQNALESQMRLYRGITYEQLLVYAAEQRSLQKSYRAIRWRSDISLLTNLAFAELPQPSKTLIVNHPDPPVKPPPDRLPVRFFNVQVEAPYRLCHSEADEEKAMAEARRLWPLISEYTSDQISEITGVEKFRLHNVLGSRRACALKLSQADRSGRRRRKKTDSSDGSEK
ncbi:hypothetical protein [Acidiphilium sp.]|uniref:hypothetical protein n=1 Tax=Acidiphilium sp. TaxID=527 RepID=UPI003CFDE462